MMETDVHINARVAAELAAAGFSVFPCEEGGQPGTIKRPKPGVFWRSASTTDRTKVAGWWRKWPTAAVGLDLAKSGLLVMDADRHDEDRDGVAAIARIFHENGFDPDQCPLVATPNQGTHYYFRQSARKPFGNSEGALKGQGINIRGAGGYVIAPGTVMADGRHYELFGALTDAPDMPAWLVDLLQAPRHDVSPSPVPPSTRPSDERLAAYVDAAIEQELDAVRTAPSGHRNNQLNASAFALGQMVGAGWVGEAQVSAMLENAAASLAQDDGLPSVRKTIRSGLSSGRQQPRELPRDQYPITEVDGDQAARLLASFEAKKRGAPVEVADDADDITAPAPQFDLPDSHLQPPGIIGEIADWICDWTAEPIRIHAIGAALVIVGTLLGRKVYSLTRPTSTALYIGAIAPSGMGKQHPQDAIRLVLEEVTGGSHQHMGWNVSLPALVVALQTNASKVMIADEFADKLIGIRSKNASTSQMAISEGLRSLWGTNTGTYSPDISLTRGDAKIMRPVLSFYGASTIKDFARSLVSKDVTNGLFNRFLLLPRYGEVERRPDRDGIMTLPAPLRDRLQWLHNCVPSMQMTMAARGDGYPQPHLIPFTDEAAAINEQNRITQQAALSASEQDDVMMLWGRFAEQVKRIALIIACGRCASDISTATITAADMAFATALVTYSINQFVTIVRRDMVESWVQAQHKLVLGIIRDAGMISKSDMVNKIDGRIQRKGREDIIASLIDGGNVEAMKIDPGPRGGRPKEVYRYLRG